MQYNNETCNGSICSTANVETYGPKKVRKWGKDETQRDHPFFAI